MATPQSTDELESALLQNYLLVAPFALYTYDRLINLTREMDLVWRRPGQRRIPVVPILYGLMHVCTPVYFILNIATLWNLSCKKFVFIYIITLVFGADICVLYLTWGVISALRIHAINPRDWFTPSVIFVLFLVPVATNLLYASSCALVDTVCSPWVPDLFIVEISTRVSAIIGDTLVLLATWRVTYGVRQVYPLGKSNLPISLLLLRDGTLYFGTLLVLNIFSTVCWAKIPAFQDFDNFIYSLTTVLLSRLFFNLREVSLLQSTIRTSGDASYTDESHTLSWVPAEYMQTCSTTLSVLGGSLVSGHPGDESADTIHENDGTGQGVLEYYSLDPL
ncbi:hypothetical protein FOMPIDRAFT_1050015 [Fomitopsis schrenkii]|uniref:DUF6533 domain-containing protein n=1 Tax=Fomitopsis schrenkii TaxID=2126942 RepID=S8FPJ2_FOMSC|nr:hypothetical protein FOMPIDRAFT_1050015 [Fomitopsis schrenkii]